MEPPLPGFLNRTPTKRDALFLDPSNCLLKFPVNRLPQVPLRRETPVSRAFFYTFLSNAPFPLKSPVNEPPSVFPNRFPMEKYASSPEPVVYSLIYIHLVPNKEPTHEKWG
jgi:hypothetical protein